MSITKPFPVTECRDQFPSLKRQVDGRPAVFLDGPAGTQVPQRVIDAISDYLTTCNANHGGQFATSMESDQRLAEAQQAYADFVGCGDPDEISFGQNMTSLTFAMSRAISNRWNPGDEIVVTRLDHDANVAPWVRAAADRDVTVRFVDVRSEDCTLDEDDFEKKLSPKTKLVAVGAASNASGSVNRLQDLIPKAHDVGALVYVDAVHYAPHALIDVEQWQADFVAFSAYKFFGPHTGILWGRRELLESIEAYKVRPASNALPEKWMTGTQSHESIMGSKEAVDYIADLGRDDDQPSLSRRDALRSAFDRIRNYENELCRQLLDGLAMIPEIRVWGITDPDSIDRRLPTISITHENIPTPTLATELGKRGIFVWDGHYYALELVESLGLADEGMVRIGLVHYNTSEEVQRLLKTLAELTETHR